MEYENIESIKKREELNRGIHLVFNNRPIPIPIRFSFKDVLTLDELVDRLEYLEDKLQNIEAGKTILKLNDVQAQSMIIGYIKQKKSEGINQLDILDIYQDLKLPFDQIKRIMELLKARGVKEIND